MRAIAGILWMSFISAAAQTPGASPQFEVASIKLAPPPKEDRMFVGSHGGPGTDDPGLWTCENCDLSWFLSLGFGLMDYQLSVPDWIRFNKFNVSAKISPGTTPEQFHAMIQNLLAERFKLQFHYQKKEMPMFELVVARGGPKMKESPGALPAPDPDAPPPSPDSSKKDANGFPILPPGRQPTGMFTGSGAILRFADESMAQFIRQISGQVRKPVTDATGLKGKYDFTLQWVPDRGGVSDSGPNIFQALQDQLGLKLESKKGMIDILVVDHIEKTPTEN